MTLEKVIRNLKGLDTATSLSDFYSDIVIAFENYEYEGVSKIQVTQDGNGVFQAYADHINSPVVFIKTDDELTTNTGEYKILDIKIYR